MKNIIFQIIIIFFFTTNILKANPPKIDGLKFYTDNMPWFNLDNEKDLIDLSNIDCQWSQKLLIQNKIVRSGKIAWKFKNGDGDCGQQRKSREATAC